jgi:hypothetical protein
MLGGANRRLMIDVLERRLSFNFISANRANAASEAASNTDGSID